MQMLLQRRAVERHQAQGLEGARPLAQVAPEKAAHDGQQAMRNGRIDLRPSRGRGEQGQAHLGVFRDVAVVVQINVLAPVAGLDQALVRVAFDGEKAREVTRYTFDKRLRSIEQGPDGAIWIAEDGKGGRVLKLTAK